MDDSAQGPNNEETSAYASSMVDAALFSRVEQLIARARLTQDERVAVDTAAVASEVHSARKEFEMGHLDQALRAVMRISASFEQRVAQWDNLARRKEQNKRNLSMLQIRKMQAEHSGVRTRVQLVRAQIRRLRTGLDQLETMAGSRPLESETAETQEPAAESSEAQEPAAEANEARAPKTTEGSAQLPSGLVEALEAANDAEGRSEVVQQYFEIEAELDVEIRKEGRQQRVIFSPAPVPPVNRFYFLLDTGQIIRTRRARIAEVIHVEYPAVGEAEPMPLKEFIRHVRKGVWLLRSKSPNEQDGTASL